MDIISDRAKVSLVGLCLFLGSQYSGDKEMPIYRRSQSGEQEVYKKVKYEL